MRTLLVLAAAAGFPLYALAQPVADDGQPTEISGLTVAAGTGQCPPGDPHGRYAISKLFDAPQDTKNRRTEEAAGTRAFVQAMAVGARSDDIDYTHVPLGFAKPMRAQFPRFRPFIACQGVFKSIKFLHVSEDGDDDFEVDFSNGALEWQVSRIHALQLTFQTGLRYFYPQPATSQFEDMLKSIEGGQPTYADLAPDGASKLQAQWPALQASLKDWGPRKGFRFLRREDDGAYVYLATYDHRQVVWTASVSGADGKLAALTYDAKAQSPTQTERKP